MNAKAELRYYPHLRELRSLGGTTLLEDVSLDEAAEAFLGVVIVAKWPAKPVYTTLPV